MDRLDEMRVFARVVERRSFRQAAQDLAIPASTVTDAVKRAEKRLGVRLLDRTTRLVAPTPEGELWYRRCLSLVAEAEDAEMMFRIGPPEGRLRIETHGTLARHVLMPALPAFLAQYPRIDVVLSENDTLGNLAREGVDCFILVGDLPDTDLFVRRLGFLTEVTVAAPSYLYLFGTPGTINALAGHRMVGFLPADASLPVPLQFTTDGGNVELRLPTTLTVTAAESLVSATLLGLGLAQMPRYCLERHLAAGQLREVLESHRPEPSPVSALFLRGRQRSPRLRVFLDWLVELQSCWQS